MNFDTPNPDQVVFALRVGWRLRRWRFKNGALLEEDGGRGKRSFKVTPETVEALLKSKTLQAEKSRPDEAHRFTDFVLRDQKPAKGLFE